tara:strand:+ start:124 stop:660 length:537 start_codon:yes stop_codon:yes gene_type:complete
MNNNDDLFLKHMRGVSPIKKNNRVKKEEPKNKKQFIKKITKKPNAEPPAFDKVIKNSEFALEKIGLKKGIKKGSLRIDKKIDFHGKNLLESEEIFTSSILDNYNIGNRCLLFITGKGLKSNNIKNIDRPKLYHSVIRAAFLEWVKSKKFSKYILSFEQAFVEHGGGGAFYVYLRKKKY